MPHHTSTHGRLLRSFLKTCVRSRYLCERSRQRHEPSRIGISDLLREKTFYYSHSFSKRGKRKKDGRSKSVWRRNLYSGMASLSGCTTARKDMYSTKPNFENRNKSVYSQAWLSISPTTAQPCAKKNIYPEDDPLLKLIQRQNPSWRLPVPTPPPYM
jgi:hypothetical protein